MVRKSYYTVLGVLPNESQRGIRSAFTELARRYHPDRVGPQWLWVFQEVVEAYQVLSDPVRRRYYDLGLSHGDPRIAVGHEGVFTACGVTSDALVPHPGIPLRAEISPGVFEAAIAQIGRFAGAGDAAGAREPSQPLNMQLILSPAQAARGGPVLLSVPSCSPCEQCGGSGRDGLFTCSFCQGEGLTEEAETVRVSIPPMVGDGMIIEVPLRGLGVHNFHLRLHIRVAY